MIRCEIIIGDHIFKGKWDSPSHFILQYLLIRIFHSNKSLPDRAEMPLKHPLNPYYDAVKKYQSLLEKSSEVPRSILGNVLFTIKCGFYLFIIDYAQVITPKLLQRLQHPDQFVGAMHEVYTTALFYKSGFEIYLENEEDRSISHCEFTARHASGAFYSVEAKIKHRKFKEDSISDIDNLYPKLNCRISEALEKNHNFPLVIVADINVPAANEGHIDTWIDKSRKMVNEILETRLRHGNYPATAFFLLLIAPERNSHAISDFVGKKIMVTHASTSQTIDDNLVAPIYDLEKGFMSIEKIPHDFSDLFSFALRSQ